MDIYFRLVAHAMSLAKCKVFEERGLYVSVKATLLEIQLCYSNAADSGREPTAQELGAIMERHYPALFSGRKRYWRGLGQFVGASLDGFVPDPQRWEPPD